MATVDETVRQVILAYPSSYTNRRQVLEKLFTVLANAREWKNGEIVRMEGLGSYEPWSAETERAAFEAEVVTYRSSRYQAIYGDNLDGFIQRMQDESERQIAECQQVVDTVDERVHLWVEDSDHSIFYQDDTALLMNVPADVKPDWREAAEQMKVYAAARGWVF